MPITLRRLLLWTIVCVFSAAPSFVVARESFNVAAMIAAVFLFICIYTAITGTPTFLRIYGRPFMRRTMYIGYGLRMLISLLVPLGIWADMLPGILSVNIVEALGIETESFAGTFVITCIQGTFLNIILFILMSIIYGIQRAFMRPPVEPQGFQVIMPSAQSPVPAQPLGDGP